MIAVALAIGAIGNRCWGAAEGSKWLGVLIMTLGIIVAKPELALWFPLVAGLVFFFRVWETGNTWLAVTRGKNIIKACLRGSALFPLAALSAYVQHSLWPIYLGLTFPLIALVYYLCGRAWPRQSVELAELLTGAYLVGVIAYPITRII